MPTQVADGVGTARNAEIGETADLSLFLNGVLQPSDTYGSSLSTATYKLNEYFTGTGIFSVGAIPEPSSIILLLLSLIALATRRRGP